MLELFASPAAVVACVGRADALDALAVPAAFAGRVAPDELLLLGPLGEAAELERAASALFEDDPDGLVVDQSSGWSCWSLAGDECDEAFARLSAVPLPAERPAFLQGAVAGVQAKVLARGARLDVLVLSTVGHHLRRRVISACRDLELRELPPCELELPAAAAVAGPESA